MTKAPPFRFRALYVKVLAFFAFSTLLLFILGNTMVDAVDGTSSEYRAKFADVSGLGVGDDVRIAGVQVGKVTGLEVDSSSPTTALVTFTVRDDQPLLSNATLVMRYQNLLGQRYLSLVQPEQHGTRMPAGSTVPLTRTSPGFDLTQLLNGFRPLFDVLQPADVNKLSESVIKVLQGEGGTVAQLLNQTAQLTNFLADRDQLFGAVFDNLTPVLVDLAGQGDELRATVRDLAAFMEGLADERKTFGQSIQSMSKTVDTSEKLLKDIRGPLATNVQKSKALLEMYASEKQRFGDSISAMGGVMDSLGRVMSYRNALTFYFCAVDIKAGTVTVETSTLPLAYSEVCQ